MSDFYEYEYKDGEKMLDYIEKMIKKKRRQLKRKEPKKSEYYKYSSWEEMEAAIDAFENSPIECYEGRDLLECLIEIDDEVTKITGMTKKERKEFGDLIHKKYEEYKKKKAKELAGKSPA